MDRLVGAEELLDGPLEDLGDLAGNLRDLRRLNRILGGTTLSLRAIARFPSPDGGPLRVIDVGTGGADIPVALRRRWPRDSPPPLVTAVDSRPEVLRAAHIAQPGLAREPGLELAVADGRALPYPSRAFDVAHSSMVLHHLDPPEAVAFLRELGRVARGGVVVNDLDRGPWRWLGAWLLGHLITRNPLTRNDAPLSVRRAYRPAEVATLLRRAGLRPIALELGFLGHRYAISALPMAAPRDGP
jgi:ubiquinone/menaquinone biosynthesis C-methylase UbiE